MNKIIQCKKCLNSSLNPSICINENGLCNVCNDYEKGFDKERLLEELVFLQNMQTSKKYDCMVGLSGGKDSTAMLKRVIDLGFKPLAFSFDIGYNSLSDHTIECLKKITGIFGVDYIVIDIKKYISNNDRECFRLMGDFYEKTEKKEISRREFIDKYKEGRKHYSTKDKSEFAFVRPCQICRKVAIKAYYAEAKKREIPIVFVGINEWATKKNGYYSSIRELKPDKENEGVFIVHLPYLLQQSYLETRNVIEKMHCESLVQELQVETGGNCCSLAKSCERIAMDMMGFHLDSARLSREITVGFITKEQAEKALEHGKRESDYTTNEVLRDHRII